MFILGIDPGFGRTGWGIISKSNGVLVVKSFGCIETASNLEMSMRLLQLFREINRIVEEIQKRQYERRKREKGLT